MKYLLKMYIYQCINIFLRKTYNLSKSRRFLMLAKSCTTLSKLRLATNSCSMLKIARLLKRDWDIVLRRNVFINFNFENERSAEAVVTGEVKYKISAVQTFGKFEANVL